MSGRKGNGCAERRKLRQREIGEHDLPPEHVDTQPGMHQHEHHRCRERKP